MADSDSDPIKEIAQKTLQANKNHQYALKVYTERLEAELATVDKLLTSADWDEQEEEADLDAGGFVLIPGSVKPSGPVAHSELLSKDSPFLEDASRRQRYLELTTIHPMKNKELDALAEAVRTENYRMHAYEAQRRGQNALTSLNQQPQSYFEINKEGIDWDRVASKVSSSILSSVQRSAKECEIRWLGDRHPEINHERWSDTEIAQAKALAANYTDGRVNWVKVAEQLGTNRTPMDCMRNVVPRKIHTWTNEADERLLEAVKIYGIDNWLLVAQYVSEDATAQQCQNRYNRTLSPDLVRGPWTEEEDNKLRRAVEAFGNSWLEVAACIPGRSNEQCRDRWSERLNPKVTKGKWTNEEDRRLLETVERVGEKWKEVSDSLGSGRTDKMCRARYDKLKKEQGREQERIAQPEPTLETSQSLRHQEEPNSGQEIALEPGTANEAQQPLSVPNVPAGATRPKPKPRQRKKGKETVSASAGSAEGATAQEPSPAGNTPGEADPEPAQGSSHATAPASKRSRKNTALAQDADAPAPKRTKPTKKAAATAGAPAETSQVGEVQETPEKTDNPALAEGETMPVPVIGTKGKAKAPPKPRTRARKKKDVESTLENEHLAYRETTGQSQTVDATSTGPAAPDAEAVTSATDPGPKGEASGVQEATSAKANEEGQKSAGTKPRSPTRAGTRRSTRLKQTTEQS